MTRTDLLRILLAAADDVARVFDHSEITTWPAGALDALRKCGLLRQAQTGLHAPCPNCADAHVEPVTIRSGPGDANRYCIWCPEAMRVDVAPEMCNGWEVDRSGLAAAVGVAMGIASTPRPVVPERFWRLGRTPWPPGTGQTREVVLAVRMHDADAPAIAAHVGPGGRAIVLVPQHRPDGRLWSHPAPAVVPLVDVLSMGDGELTIDVSAVIEIVRAADTAAHQTAGLSLTKSELTSIVRRQVKAEKKSELTDDAILQAYRIYGTARDTEEALRKEGYVVDHSTIARKVKKAEEANDLREGRDSPSVARTVASQRRDRGKKIMERR